MTIQRRLLGITVAILALALLAPATAQAVDFGVRAGVYADESDAFVGVEALAGLGGPWYFNPNAEFVFVDNGNLFTINGDVHYDFDVDSPAYVWIGGGPALIVRDPDRPRNADSETDFGLNLLAGIGWKASGFVPYVQGKVVLSDETEAVLGFGVRF
jgi:hypothetical protein